MQKQKQKQKQKQMQVLRLVPVRRDSLGMTVRRLGFVRSHPFGRCGDRMDGARGLCEWREVGWGLCGPRSQNRDRGHPCLCWIEMGWVGVCAVPPIRSLRRPNGWGTVVCASGERWVGVRAVPGLKIETGGTPFRAGLRGISWGLCGPRSQNRDRGRPCLCWIEMGWVGVCAVPGLKIETGGTGWVVRPRWGCR